MFFETDKEIRPYKILNAAEMRLRSLLPLLTEPMLCDGKSNNVALYVNAADPNEQASICIVALEDGKYALCGNPPGRPMKELATGSLLHIVDVAVEIMLMGILAYCDGTTGSIIECFDLLQNGEWVAVSPSDARTPPNVRVRAQAVPLKPKAPPEDRSKHEQRDGCHWIVPQKYITQATIPDAEIEALTFDTDEVRPSLVRFESANGLGWSFQFEHLIRHLCTCARLVFLDTNAVMRQGLNLWKSEIESFLMVSSPNAMEAISEDFDGFDGCHGFAYFAHRNLPYHWNNLRHWVITFELVEENGEQVVHVQERLHNPDSNVVPLNRNVAQGETL